MRKVLSRSVVGLLILLLLAGAFIVFALWGWPSGEFGDQW